MKNDSPQDCQWGRFTIIEAKDFQNGNMTFDLEMAMKIFQGPKGGKWIPQVPKPLDWKIRFVYNNTKSQPAKRNFRSRYYNWHAEIDQFTLRESRISYEIWWQLSKKAFFILHRWKMNEGFWSVKLSLIQEENPRCKVTMKILYHRSKGLPVFLISTQKIKFPMK